MQPIIYDVAVSLDGYISGPGGDISGFAHDGPVVEDYKARMRGYAVAIMGRATYEFGYRYGLEPGRNPYAPMRTVVFSATLDCPADAGIEVARSSEAQILHDLKAAADGPIYLCGGGEFAGWLLAAGLIDRLRLKRAPVLLGGGVRLFGTQPRAAPLTPLDAKTYENGYVYQEFATT